MAERWSLGKANFFDNEVERGMAVFIQATRFKLVQKMWKYMFGKFKEIFIKHSTIETEVAIENNNIDDEWWENINTLREESKILDFKSNINNILDPWLTEFDGHPHQENNMMLASTIRDKILKEINLAVHSLQERVLMNRRHAENQECNTKCIEGPKVINLTKYVFSKEIMDQLRKGLSSIPRIKEGHPKTIARINLEIKTAAMRYFFHLNGFRAPKEIMKLNYRSFTKQLLILSAGSTTENNFFYVLCDNFYKSMEALDGTFRGNGGIDDMKVLEALPNDVVVSNADKNIGTVILPIEWFIEEYQRQQVKGGYESIDLTEKECLDRLDFTIIKFREFCNAYQNELLSKVWPRPQFKKSIGICKLVPKLHKLKNKIDDNSWKELRGRPIRGAEQCPTNAPSIALCKLLQEMLRKLRQEYKTLAPGCILASLDFPILKGCDDYSKQIQDIKLMDEKFSSTFIITADFSDAYTLSLRSRLQESIKFIGEALGYYIGHTSLMIALVNLVFDNVFFYTVYGLQRSTKGYPMGGHASRDALDVDLVRSELEILSNLMFSSSKIHLYGRMVDDINIIYQGDFDGMTKILITMARFYPNMPLNLQISQVFGKFLDTSIYNFKSKDNASYNLTTTLLWKKLNTYNYIEEGDNRYEGYKGTVVPVTLHRIHRRCNRVDEMYHHNDFIFKILSKRGQSSTRLENKRTNFFKKLGKEKLKKALEHDFVFTTVFDDVSKTHEITSKIIERSASFRYHLIKKSKPNMAAKLCPKRKILDRVKTFYEKPTL